MPFDTVSGVGETRIRIYAVIAYPLMWSSVVVEVAIDVDDVAQAAIADEPELVQAFGFERQEEAFDVRIAVGRARWGAQDLNSRAA